MTVTGESRDLTLDVGRDELVIRRRYETLGIVNDILIGIWFLVGSILFFSDSTTYTGTWLFVIGSVELLIRPIIRLARHVHLRRIRTPMSVRAATGLRSARRVDAEWR
ncbi:YrhK family protein [Pseudonocardia tropica]|uniref:YrhK family protein n=2 Tax=Pseudonocardia TaxID=1847 RepID=A0ABV1K496_9PSEU|nr:YrhK family protein [Pseudonocardia sediminis]